tara:strand:+ start:354 stop:560 length:207 start_codon:yes stop_codon:yes gene_type:complete
MIRRVSEDFKHRRVWAASAKIGKFDSVSGNLTLAEALSAARNWKATGFEGVTVYLEAFSPRELKQLLK